MTKLGSYWKENGAAIQRTLERWAFIALAILPLVVFAVAWGRDGWGKLTESWPYFCGWLANLCAMMALTLAVVMVCLGSRTPALERRFGLDRMLRFHQVIGPVVVGLLMVHAFLRMTKLSLVSAEGWRWDFLYTWSFGNLTETGLSGGRTALAVLLIAAGLARMRRYFLPYHLWKIPHLGVYLVVALGFTHSMIMGVDEMGHFPYVIVWSALLAVFLWEVTHRIRYMRSRKALYTCSLVESTPETDDTRTLRLAPKAGPAPYGARRPGQFAVIRYKRKYGYSQPRPFTISALPAAEQLSFTIKKTGRFTTKLHGLPPGIPFLCEGPYGVFTPDFSREKNLVLIAGGVGITPFLSILRHIRQTGLDAKATLIWSNKTRKDCIACDELTEMAADGFLRVVHLLSREAPPQETDANGSVVFEAGHVDVGILKKYVNPCKASFYLCGPPAMQGFVLGELRKAFGVKPCRVKRELFAW